MTTALRPVWPSIVKGDNYKLEVTVVDASTGAVKDLTSATVTWDMYLDGTLAYSRSTGGSGVTLTDAANGELTVDGATASLDAGVYNGYLTVTDSAGRISTVYRVVVKILPKS